MRAYLGNTRQGKRRGVGAATGVRHLQQLDGYRASTLSRRQRYRHIATKESPDD